ncbi:hypothetical protein GB937_005194 [Aspergillus fischeri]|nr:hypothetical protein GB937_005194 [Aspergillus fischeri]
MHSFLTLAVAISAILAIGSVAYPTDALELEARSQITKRSLPRLVNFDNNNADDRKKNLKIRQAFRDSLQLMDYVINGLNDGVFKQYFNEADKSKVQSVFQKALGGDPARGADELGGLYITNIDVNKECGDDPTLLAYTGDTVGATMAVMGATLLHEFLHADTIGKAALKTSTALIVAAAFGSESVMDLLLTQEDIDVNARNMHVACYTFHGITPFALAVANGNIGIAKALLDTDRVNVNFRDAQGRTPLHHAVLSKHEPSVLLLLSRKEIDIQLQDESQCTPLWCATECGNLDAAQLLLMYGANPNICDYHRITPLNNAICQRDTAMVELLLNQDDLVIPRHVGWAERAQPTLCAAVCVGDANILRMLLCHMAEWVNTYNYDGYQPLLLAVRRGDSSMVKLLLSHKDIDVNKRGIDINAKDEWGTTPLWWATKSGHCSVVKRLLAESTLDLNGFVELLSPLHPCR